jgi:hypothetical protein
MTMFYDNAPDALRREMYAWLDQNSASERKPGMTDEQFYYKSRKNAVGPFKRQLYGLGSTEREKITAAWEKQFGRLFDLLGAAGTRQHVQAFVHPTPVEPDPEFYLGKASALAMADDLQD